MTQTGFHPSGQGKAAGLRAARAAGFRVPNFESLTAECFDGHLETLDGDLRLLNDAAGEVAALPAEAQLERLRAPAAALRDRIVERPIDPRTCETIRTITSRLGAPVFAVRSDMNGEDSSDYSYAGQLESHLFVDSAGVEQAVARCWASAFSDRVLVYALRAGVLPAQLKVSVVIQEMIAADAAGVAFSIDPVTGSDECIIAASWGVGEGVVAGTADADEYRWSRVGGELAADIPVKHTKVAVSEAGGTALGDVALDLRCERVLTQDQVSVIAEMSKDLEQLFAYPVDVEWCLKDRILYLLQVRPITAIGGERKPAGSPRSYDNSNIQESFNGYTTPLTFSLASLAYQRVFVDLARCIGVSDADLARFDGGAARCMLAYLNGRVFYNLSSWYQLLALMPNYEANKRETEKVMWHLEQPGESPGASSTDGLRGRLRRVRVGIQILRRLGLLDYSVPKFVDRFHRLYASVDRAALADASMEELQETLRVIYQEIMADWRIPNLNDLKVMMLCGRLRRLAEHHTGRGVQIGFADLISGIDGIESLRPTFEITDIAAAVRADTQLMTLFDDDELDSQSIYAALEASTGGIL